MATKTPVKTPKKTEKASVAKVAKATEFGMAELIEKYDMGLIPFREGEVTEVTILEVEPKQIQVDVAGVNVGIVPEREFSFDSLELKPGEKVVAYVLSAENEIGQVVLSLRRADRERLWKNLTEKYDSQAVMAVKIKDANRGGLIVETGGVEGFLPVSQLSPKNYPKVLQGDSNVILERLNQLVGQTLQVKILNIDRNTNKLIFSEKATANLSEEAAVDTVKIGDVMEGTITGVVAFGLFVNLGEVEGLVHISEVAWDRVDNINDRFKVGDKIKVKVTQIEGNRVSLSIKRLLADPWAKEAKKLKVDSTITGTVTRITNFGAFVKISDSIDGLAHISQLGEDVKNPADVVTEGKQYQFKITSIDPESHKVSLQLETGSKAKAPAKTEEGEASNDNKKSRKPARTDK